MKDAELIQSVSHWRSLERKSVRKRGQCIAQTGGGQLVPTADVYISPTARPLKNEEKKTERT